MTVPPHLTPPEPSWRKPAGIILILALITVWAVIVSEVMGYFENIPTVLAVIIYGVAGVVWILPLRPILIWMETGRFR